MFVDKFDNKTKQKERILIVHSGGECLRGSEIQILETISVLRANAREVYLVCDQQIMLQAAKERRIPCERINCAEFMIDGDYHRLNLFGLIKSNMTVAKITRKYNIQVVYSNSGRANQMSYFGARLVGVPVICHVHCFYNFRYLKLYMVNRTDVTIHCSQAIASQNEKKLCSRRYEVALNGVDFSRLIWDVPDYGARKTIGIPNGSIVIGYLGAIIESKGVEVLLKAFSELRKQQDNLKIVLGGNGDINKYVSLSKELGIADHVIFLGHVDKPDNFFRNLVDIHVMPSPIESFGRTVVEAAACGVFSVAADAGGLREAMLDGAFGIFFEPGNTQSLVQAINAMIESDSWRSKSAQLREIATAQFDIHRRAMKIINIIDAL